MIYTGIRTWKVTWIDKNMNYSSLSTGQQKKKFFLKKLFWPMSNSGGDANENPDISTEILICTSVATEVFGQLATTCHNLIRFSDLSL